MSGKLRALSSMAAIALILGHGPAQADVERQSYRTKGGSALASGFASIYNEDGESCGNIRASVGGNQMRSRSNGTATRSNVAFASIEHYDTCAGTYVYGSVEDAAGVLTAPSRRLLSAEVEEFTFPVRACEMSSGDWVCRDATATAAAAWTGVGDIAHIQSRYHFRQGGYTYMSRQNGLDRSANIVMRVEVDGEPVAFDWIDGALGYANSGWLEIIRSVP